MTKWVIGYYEGDRARSVAAHAHAGIGYFVLEESGKGNGYHVAAAFRYAGTDMPDNLIEIHDPEAIAKLERKQAQRQGGI